MGQVQTTVEINADAETVYHYLRHRYVSSKFKNVFYENIGYVPNIACVQEKEKENERLKCLFLGRWPG